MLRRKQLSQMEHLCDATHLRRQRSKYSITYAAIFHRGNIASRLHTNTLTPSKRYPSIHAEVNALREMSRLDLDPTRCVLLILRMTPGGHVANAESCTHCALIIRHSRIAMVASSLTGTGWQRHLGATIHSVYESYGWRSRRSKRQSLLPK